LTVQTDGSTANALVDSKVSIKTESKYLFIFIRDGSAKMSKYKHKNAQKDTVQGHGASAENGF
jgi:hypothetical protein